jgi:hypothetical protein
VNNIVKAVFRGPDLHPFTHKKNVRMTDKYDNVMYVDRQHWLHKTHENHKQIKNNKSVLFLHKLLCDAHFPPVNYFY